MAINSVRTREAASTRTRAQAPRSHDPEGNRRDILEVATREFAEKGFSGARIAEIAGRTRTSKRMIYYYFGDKERLYIAVLEEAYRRIRSVEATLDLTHQPPEQALRALVGFTFDYQNAHPEFVRLVMNENILNGAYVARSKDIQRLNSAVIESIRALLARGERAGVFRPGLDAVALHMSISALCFFNVANRATFSAIFKRDMASPRALRARRAEIAELVVRYVRREPRRVDSN
jgi:AcrR family transcriptional regulator